MSLASADTTIYDAALIEEREFWLKRLGTSPRGAAAVASDANGATATPSEFVFDVPADVTASAARLTNGSPFLLYTTLVAALKVCLRRYAGGASVAVGSPATAEAARPNALVIHVELDDAAPFRALLMGVRETLLAAYERQRYPFANLLRDMNLAQESDACPLFEVALRLEGLHGPMPAVGNHITVNCAERGEVINCRVEFDASRHTRARIEAFGSHFVQLLREALADKERPVGELSMMSDDELRRVVFEWNARENDAAAAGTEDSTAPFVSAISLFEKWAAETPHSLALAWGNERLTYAELDARSNRLARYLGQYGVGAEVRVALCIDRSPELVVALLAVMKAGGTYLPLDPSYPMERLGYMLEDSAAPLLITRGEIADELPAFWGQVIDIDEVQEELAALSAQSVNEVACGAQGAYMIYTSGSTGKPKGVVVTHAGLFNLTQAQRRVYEVGPRERVLQFASFSFDASVAEVSLALCHGASLWLASREETLPGPGLFELLDRCEITNVTLPPSLLLTLPDAELPHLRTLLVAGEACPAEVVERWGATRKLFNAYGPTEATVWATVKECEPGAGAPTIGRPVFNTETYILDARLRPVPVGVAGELYIAGNGLARGYLNRPELTAERFVPHPFSKEPGRRLYKTGDVARFRAAGEIEFLGRADEQVKIRGFRIELGEVEATLREHPQVCDCVVAARGVAGGQRLVGYFVAEPGAQPTTSELHNFLQERLPDYMVPSVFVALDALPLTPNGKVDKRALPEPDAARPELKESFAAPRTPAEVSLAKIWSDVLGLERVGIHDNFFELGGDSILSIQIIARANQAGLQLGPKSMFEHQTVAELAAVAGTGPAVAAEQEAVTGEVPLTPIQQWFFAQESPAPHHYNQAVLLSTRERPDVAVLREVVARLSEHHDALRLRFAREADGWRQFNAGADESLPFAVVDLSGFAPDERRARLDAAVEELHASLDLSAGPLARVAFFDYGAEEPGRLFIVVHHLAVDGVSWRILLEDFQLAYGQASRGERVALGAKTTAFRQWAERLSEYAESEELRNELGYWLDESRMSVASLPTDFTLTEHHPALDTARGVRVALTAEETRALLKDVPAAYSTQINDVLLTALAQALTTWAGGRSLLVSLEGHGREEIGADLDLSRTVGWFTSVYPALLDLGETHAPGDALKTIKEQLRAVPNRGVGYGVLRYMSTHGAAELLGALPQPDVSFNYLGQFDQVLDESAPFGPATESSGRGQSPDGRRPHLLEVNGSVNGGRLQLVWTYSDNVHREATVRRLADDFVESLRALIAHCSSAEEEGHTPSDFPLAGLTQQEVDHLVETYGRVEDVYPLSPLQQGLLFHTLYSADSGVYFTQVNCVLPATLDVESFKRAWAEAVERHAILRTAFAWSGLAEPMQVVCRGARMPWDEQDWRGLDWQEQEARLQAYLEENQRRGFDLAVAPLMRAALIRRDAETYQFVWSLHHLLLDGWALFIVIKEVFAAYEALLAGNTYSPAPARPFRAFIAWLQQQKQSDEAFWREALKGFKAPTSLGVDSPAPAAHDAEGEHRDARGKLSAETTAALQDLARRHQLTLNTLAQGAWAVLLSRYSGERDVVFGATAAGRPATLEGVEGMVGPFINMLPVRARVPEGARLLPWLKKLQAQQAEARQFEYSPLARIQSWSDVPRGQALFESVMIFENFPVDESLRSARSEGRLEAKRVSAVEKMNYPLALVVMPGHELGLRLAYHSTRFDDATIGRMLGHLQTLLSGMAARPEAALADFELLTGEERLQLASVWNAGREREASALPGTQHTSPEPFVSAVHLFENWAAETPRALALSFKDERLTYAELDARSNRLARLLRQYGVGAEVRVALCLNRSTELVVALLAVLKAGGTYLPLDPSYPIERLAYMLEDSAAAVLITRGELADELPSFWGQVIDIEEVCEELEEQSAEGVNEIQSGAQGAYMIYTSGSTGKPKGVVVPHRGLYNLTRAQAESFGPGPEDRVLQFASLSFDASVFEIAMALCSGASLWLAPREELMPGPGLVSLLERCGITNATLPPSVLTLLPTAELPNLRTLIVAGEACPAEVVERWGAGRQFFNAYGPTETTVWATVKECEPGAGAPNIGRPVEGAEVFILDGQWRPVPVGVKGELCLGGAGLARGYLNRPELTAERFVPHPFSKEPGARLYRTGDVARFSPEGEVEFLGRADEQVKVRGFRIELGEVESALREHPQVCECVVTAREEGGLRRLVGYVVAEAGAHPTTGELRGFLQERLPDYMLPAVFVTLASMPLTPNGKIDRNALPAPDESRPELAEAFAAPRTSAEEALAQIWSEVLHVERVGIDDNYFTLGGDSIRSVQILARAQERGLGLTLPQLFQHQTIRQLASELSTVELSASLGARHGEPFGLVSDEVRAQLPDGLEDAYPLTTTQAGMLFHSEMNPETAIYLSINTFHLKAALDVEALGEALRRTVARHALLRTSFDLNTYGEPLQLVWRTAEAPLRVHDLRSLSADEREAEFAAWLEVEKLRHFDWTDAPLVRFDVHRRTDETFQFTFVAHHAVIDGWSDGVFLTEFFKLYVALVKGEEPAAEPPPASSYSHFVALEREAVESQETRRFWLDKLADLAPAKLPRRGPRDEGPAEFARAVVPVSNETSEGLKRLAQEAGVPIKSVLLAAHLRVMSLLAGQSDTVTGLVWNGRPETTDGERVIGLFLNTLPFRANLRGGTWLELVRETFHAEREAMPHRRFPLGQLQRALGGQTLFETCFNFTHFHIYQSLQGFDEVELLGGGGVSETNFTLMANFSVNIGSARVSVVLDYDAAELGVEFAAPLSHYYEATLRSMAADCHARYDSAELLDADERRQLLEGFNDTRREYADANLLLHELFERQVERTPDSTALVFEGERLTYSQLNERSNRLAHLLRSEGVTADSLVGVMLERSSEMVVSLLAVLKAGGAYVPLDPSYPAERLSYMLSDSRPAVLLTHGKLSSLLPEAKSDALAGQGAGNLPRLARASNLAYMIYTSGSTGRPKGAMNTHSAIVNRLLWMQEEYGLDSSDVVMQKTPFSFDVSVWEFFWPLMTGARLVVAKPGGHQDPSYIAELIEREGVTTMHFVPSMLQAFLAEPDLSGCESLRRVVCSGEALPYELQQRFFSRLGCELHNLYGPTEAAVDVTYWACERDGARNIVPIGRPIANTQIYVLDARLEPVPVGVAGELYIAGVGLARGYHERPALTAEKFVADPHAEEPGARMYRTGDLARFLPAGEIEYLGRIDNQVKIRGNRIELGEIEAALSEQTGVAQAVVVVREDAALGAQLIGYVVASAGAELSAGEMRGSLRERLPEYMVPSVVVALAELPLTPNGKVDRRALRELKPAEATRGREYVAPANVTEEQLASLWEQVLGVERVGVEDNFFDLGGHSLTATRLISGVRGAFGVKLSLRALFAAPTVRGLAAAVEEAVLEESSAENVDELLSMLESLDEEDAAELLALDESGNEH